MTTLIETTRCLRLPWPRVPAPVRSLARWLARVWTAACRHAERPERQVPYC